MTGLFGGKATGGDILSQLKMKHKGEEGGAGGEVDNNTGGEE